MIVVDTSALLAILLQESKGEACMRRLVAESEPVISAGTFAEALIVAARRGFAEELAELIERAGFVVAPVFEADARRAGDAHDRWGRGVHAASLNFGDCFAYALARERRCPLLFVGDDFARTDITPALG